jgi:hypothetical protein
VDLAPAAQSVPGKFFLMFFAILFFAAVLAASCSSSLSLFKGTRGSRPSASSAPPSS